MCRHFLKGKCKHGFKGKTPKDGVSECKYDHPYLCKKLLNHGIGPGGCQEGENCKYTHPKMCRESVNSGKCPNPGRCHYGYHVKGTILDTSGTKNENVWSKVSGNPTPPNQINSESNSTSSFLEVMIRKEIQRMG